MSDTLKIIQICEHNIITSMNELFYGVPVEKSLVPTKMCDEIVATVSRVYKDDQVFREDLDYEIQHPNGLKWIGDSALIDALRFYIGIESEKSDDAIELLFQSESPSALSDVIGVNYENLVVNGDFKDGLAGWVSVGGAIALSGETVVLTENLLSSEHYVQTASDLVATENKRYYFSIEVISGGSAILYSKKSDGVYQQTSGNMVVGSGKSSNIMTTTTVFSPPVAILRAYGASGSRPGTGAEYGFKKCQTINITDNPYIQLIEARLGREVTVSECDYLFSLGFIGGIKTYKAADAKKQASFVMPKEMLIKSKTAIALDDWPTITALEAKLGRKLTLNECHILFNEINIPLLPRALPSGIQNAETIKRVSEDVELRGTEAWLEYVPTNARNPLIKCFYVLISNIKPATLNISASGIPTVSHAWDASNSIAISAHPITKYIYLVIEAVKLTTPDLTGFKAWLALNPVRIRYALDQEANMATMPSFDVYTTSGVLAPVAPVLFKNRMRVSYENLANKIYAKNWFNPLVVPIYTTPGVTLSQAQDKIILSNSDAGTYRRVIYLVDLLPNTLYTFSRTALETVGSQTTKCWSAVVKFEEVIPSSNIVKDVLTLKDPGAKSGSFTTGQSGKMYIAFACAWEVAMATTVEFSNIQLELGSPLTAYESFVPIRKLYGTNGTIVIDGLLTRNIAGNAATSSGILVPIAPLTGNKRAMIRMKVRVTNALCTSIATSLLPVALSKSISAPVNGQWYDVELSAVSTSFTSVTAILIVHSYASTANASNAILEIKDVFIVNATDNESVRVLESKIQRALTQPELSAVLKYSDRFGTMDIFKAGGKNLIDTITNYTPNTITCSNICEDRIPIMSSVTASEVIIPVESRLISENTLSVDLTKRVRSQFSYAQEDCDRCNGNGWYVDIVDEDNGIDYVNGSDKMAQDYLKILLSNGRMNTVGTSLVLIVGNTMSYEEATEYIINCASEALISLRSIQETMMLNGIELDDDELITNAIIDEISEFESEDGYYISISIMNRMGDEMRLALKN